MPQYVIERDVPGAHQMTEEQVRDLARASVAVLNELGPQIQWIQSYVTDGKIYCIYYAPDESLVLEHARRGGFRADRVTAVRRLLDPTNFQ